VTRRFRWASGVELSIAGGATAWTPPSDVAKLRLHRLRVLNLSSSAASDVSGLGERCPCLQELYSSNTGVVDITTLRAYGLTDLDLSFCNNLSDSISGLDLYSCLDQLDLRSTKVDDLSPLKHSSLSELNLEETPVTNIKPLASCSALCTLCTLDISYTLVHCQSARVSSGSSSRAWRRTP